jgi:hypothetical protein
MMILWFFAHTLVHTMIKSTVCFAFFALRSAVYFHTPNISADFPVMTAISGAMKALLDCDIISEKVALEDIFNSM